MANIQVLKLSSSEVKDKIWELAKLRIQVFKDFPYIYEGTEEYEKKYIQVYLDSPKAAIIAALDDNKIVGMSTCMSMLENKYVQEPFLKHNYNLNEIFYFGESVLLKDYRGLGIGNKFFDEREKHALSFSEIKTTTFCAVQRPNDHLLKPEGYQPLDEFWKKRGYKKHPELVSFFEWQDINEPKETFKPMVYWLKKHK